MNDEVEGGIEWSIPVLARRDADGKLIVGSVRAQTFDPLRERLVDSLLVVRLANANLRWHERGLVVVDVDELDAGDDLVWLQVHGEEVLEEVLAEDVVARACEDEAHVGAALAKEHRSGDVRPRAHHVVAARLVEPAELADLLREQIVVVLPPAPPLRVAHDDIGAAVVRDDAIEHAGARRGVELEEQPAHGPLVEALGLGLWPSGSGGGCPKPKAQSLKPS